MKKNVSVLFLCFLWFNFLNINNATGEESMDQKFVFFPNDRCLSSNSPYFHPKLGEANVNGVFIHVASAPFQGNLRVLLCYSHELDPPGKWAHDGLYDVPNPESLGFTGIPAQGDGMPEQRYVIFAGGSRFDAYLPPDAVPVGSDEWRYHMRWERVYGNYYAVTIYRWAQIIENGLYTEKDGRDLSPALGESSSSKTVANDGTFATYLGKIEIYHGFPKRSERDFLLLVEVKEEDLPEDFPKGLVLWLK